MERKLLLLGLLRTGNTHGYHMMEMLDKHIGMSIDLKKPTAYRLLDEMLRDGWLTMQEEKVGNRPLRKVYSLTPGGEAEFTLLLKECLARYKPAEYQHDISLMFMDALPAEEIVDLLEKRMTVMRMHRMGLQESVKAHDGSSILQHQLNHIELDCEYIEKLKDHLEKERGKYRG